ncbi:hypothetical protein D1BOALGB6SA_66 [Olavius sp. associated proteobacterium Delta 1]|nr:hypothetical protein D1BOALGB6SA_66 [Olavius sp. associated proteobacterium Delta 1]
MILFTIGYEKLDQKQFMAYLSNNGVDVVADIRKLPVSRKKGFSKTALRESLSCKGIDYINYQALGAPKELRDELYKSGNYDRFFRKYENNISAKTDYLAEILSFINSGRKVALLCFERNHQECHRKVVAEEIRKLDGNGLQVEHIVPI